MDNADQAYEHYTRLMREGGPWKWPDGRPMEDRESALYFLTMQFEKAIDDQGSLSGPDARWRGLQDGEDPIQAAILDLTGTPERRAAAARSGVTGRPLPPTFGVLAGETLTPNFWPTVILGLPNPSNIAWAYSEERQDFAGAAHVPGPIRQEGVDWPFGAIVRVTFGPDFRRIFDDLRLFAAGT